MQTVVAAAIVRGDPPRLLAARRARPAALAGSWELPGGKVEPGEADTDALRRELAEELGVDATVGGRAAPDVAILDGRATLRTYWAHVDGDPRPLEHAELRWLRVDELDDVAWLPADGPIVAAIESALRSS